MKIVIENLTDGDTVPGGVLLIRGRLSPSPSQVRETLRKSSLTSRQWLSIAGKAPGQRRVENPVGTQIWTSSPGRPRQRRYTAGSECNHTIARGAQRPFQVSGPPPSRREQVRVQRHRVLGQFDVCPLGVSGNNDAVIEGCETGVPGACRRRWEVPSP